MLAHTPSRRRRFKIQRIEIEGRRVCKSTGKIFLGLRRRTSRSRRLPDPFVGRSLDARKRRLELASDVELNSPRNLRAKCRPRHFALSLLPVTGCRACPERSRRRSPLPGEVWNPRWVSHSVNVYSLHYDNRCRVVETTRRHLLRDAI